MNFSNRFRRMILKDLTSVLTIVCAALLSFNASALGVAISAEQLKERAELVIIGKITAKTGQEMKLNEQIPDGLQEPETFNAIMTKYDIEINNVLKGNHDTSVISVFSFGGKLGDKVEKWSFGFNLNVGDDLLLFLQKSQANFIWMAVSHSQGVFRLIGTKDAWEVISVNSDHMVSPDSNTATQDYQDRTIESIESYVNSNKK